MSPKRYLTTTLPYVNAEPHIGFALELVQADIFARYLQLTGNEVFFNTGTDEHGLKIYRQAAASNQTPQVYVDAASLKFKNLQSVLGILPEVNFIRTTDATHVAAAQAFWRQCAAAGDIYKKIYQIKYCIGCELEKTDSELVNGRCALHPNLTLELIDEENYFFRFSKYQQALLDLYKKQDNFVVPTVRQNEIREFVSRGLQDFSISRLTSKMPWGVPVPDDPAQTMYVWFDALVSYISAIGWSSDKAKFATWWPVTQFAGKDNLRQQAAMWQAMLMSASLPPSKQIIIHGFILSDGQKMSKSLGNVINPVALVKEYGTDALRYYLARHVHPFEDSDFTLDRFKEAYNANLANGLGNLVSRVMKMAVTNDVRIETNDTNNKNKHLEQFEFNKAADDIWAQISKLDEQIQLEQPFKLVKTDPEQAKKFIQNYLQILFSISISLQPIMPTTAEKIKTAIKENKMPEALFPRKD